jgi:hypothetical protein
LPAPPPRSASSSPSSSVAIAEPPARKPAAPPANRRKHTRARVTVSACIRTPDYGDDVAICEDMSRGGLRFKSRKPYSKGAMIEVAVPYSPETHSIFVPAQIVHVEELSEQKFFRCGVAYLASSPVR